MNRSSEWFIDFVQMPWSNSAASWRHYGEDVWTALQKTVGTAKGSMRVHGEASGNEDLSGVLEVSSGGFKAEIRLQGQTSASSAAMTHVKAAAERYFGALNATVTAQGDAVTTTVVARFGEKEKGRIDFLLGALWDLQIFALRIPTVCAEGEEKAAD